MGGRSGRPLGNLMVAQAARAEAGGAQTDACRVQRSPTATHDKSFSQGKPAEP